MIKTKKLSPLPLTQQAAKIKISNKLHTAADTVFFKKKMEKGVKTLSIAGIPE